MLLRNRKALTISLSGFQYGYNTSIIAAAILFLKGFFELTPLQEGFVASAVLFGALLTCSFSASLANRIGRKWMNFLGACLFVLGVTLSSLATEYHLLLLGRLIVGLASGIAIIVPPIYLIEVSPPHQRGGAANLNQLGIGLGALVAYAAGYFLSFSADWRWMFGLGVFPGMLQIIALFFVPESPAMEEHKKNRGKESPWGQLFRAAYWPRLRMGLALCGLQSLLGTPAIFYFAPLLFEDGARESPITALFSTMLIGLMYFLGIVFSFWMVDRWGRRYLLLGSVIGMLFGLFGMSFASFGQIPALSLVMTLGSLLFIAAYAVGLGPIPPLVVGEATRSSLRAHAMTFTGFFGMTCNYLVTLTCPILLAEWGVATTFLVYALFGVAGLLFFWKKLPETKEKGPEEIEF